MLFGNLVGALALSAPIVQGIPTFGAAHAGLKSGAGFGAGAAGGVGVAGGVGAAGGVGVGVRGGAAVSGGAGATGGVRVGGGVRGGASVTLIAGFQTCTSLIGGYELKFRTACAAGNIGFLLSAFGRIKASIEALGVDSDTYLHAGVSALGTQVVALFVRLQVLIKIIVDYQLSSSCHAAIVELDASLKAMIHVAKSAGVNVSAKLSASLDFNLFAQIGLGFGVIRGAGVGAGGGFGAGAGFGAGVGFGAGAGAGAGLIGSVGAGAGAGIGVKAGFNVDASAKVFNEFKASTVTVDSYAPTFKTAAASKNVAVLNQGLKTIVVSITSVGGQADALVHVTVDALCSQYFELLIKLQALLKIIASYSLISSCHNSIVSLNTPLTALLSILVSAGVNVSVKAKAYTSLDLSFFASVGVSLGFTADASVNSSM